MGRSIGIVDSLFGVLKERWLLLFMGCLGRIYLVPDEVSPSLPRFLSTFDKAADEQYLLR